MQQSWHRIYQDPKKPPVWNQLDWNDTAVLFNLMMNQRSDLKSVKHKRDNQHNEHVPSVLTIQKSNIPQLLHPSPSFLSHMNLLIHYVHAYKPDQGKVRYKIISLEIHFWEDLILVCLKLRQEVKRFSLKKGCTRFWRMVDIDMASLTQEIPGL